MDAITEDEYTEEVNEIAGILARESAQAASRGQFDTAEQAAMETVGEEVEYHNWFARNYYDGSLYGSIVEHGETDPTRLSDWQALIESDTPEQTLKRLAYVVMEGDVLEHTLERLDADGD